MANPLGNIANMSRLLTSPPPAPELLYTTTGYMRIFQLLCYGFVGETIALFGIGTNIINIICFTKQGFKESININLLCLAVSDLGCVLTIIWLNACMILAFEGKNLSFDPLDMQHLSAAMPHIMFTRATAVITAFITLERCLCITMPLKVKSIITPKKVTITNICIFIFLFFCFSPIYFSTKLGPEFNAELNRTIIGLVTIKDGAHRAATETVSFAINSVLIPASALIVILVCMITMVVTLRKQTKWRQNNRGATKADGSSEREERLGRMIVMISILFVVCFLPSIVVLCTVSVDPEFSVGGKYVHISVFIYGFSTVAESTNSSMNIFIYYNMSSKYRSYFDEIFLGKNPERKQGSLNTVSTISRRNKETDQGRISDDHRI